MATSIATVLKKIIIFLLAPNNDLNNRLESWKVSNQFEYIRNIRMTLRARTTPTNDAEGTR